MAARKPRVERRRRLLDVDVLDGDERPVRPIRRGLHGLREPEPAGRRLSPRRRIDDPLDPGEATDRLAHRARMAARHDHGARQVEPAEPPARRPDRLDLAVGGRVGVATAGVDARGDDLAPAAVGDHQPGEREPAGGDVVGRETDRLAQVLLDRRHRSSSLHRW